MRSATDQLLLFANSLIERCALQPFDQIESPPCRESGPFNPKPLAGRPYNRKKLSYRESVAVLLSLIHTGQALGAGCRASRRFNFERKSFVIENGAGNDILSGGWADFEPRMNNPAEGHFVLNEQGMAGMLELWDMKALAESKLKLVHG